MTKFKYVHHACFILENKNDAIIFDPFLDDNPAGITAGDIKVSHVLVSHAHRDHLGEAIEISLKNKATIISTAEIAGMVSEKGCPAHAMHIGGTHIFPFGKVRITPAFHGAGIPGGHACGFLIDFYGTKIYYAGDTSLFGDMRLLGELENIDYAILPIGDNYTMGPSDALKAAEILKSKNIIPVHYNTWPVIEQDPQKFKQAVETEKIAKVIIVKPGCSIELD